jgi:hypothetical protein
MIQNPVIRRKMGKSGFGQHEVFAEREDAEPKSCRTQNHVYETAVEYVLTSASETSSSSPSSLSV